MSRKGKKAHDRYKEIKQSNGRKKSKIKENKKERKKKKEKESERK